MEVADILMSALRAVDDSKVPADLREVAFSKAVDLISGTGGEVAGSQQIGQPSSPLNSSSGGSDGSPLERLASKLGLELETVRSVFDIDDGEFNVVVSPNKLDKRASSGTKQIALLVAAGRQGAGLDSDWTSVDEIRKFAEDFKRLDSPNFASSIREMEEEFNVKGSPRKKEVRLSRVGWEKATEFIGRLGNGG
jgi:hypothetical protein